METVNLEMEELFDNDVGVDDDIEAAAGPSTLPDLDLDEEGPMRPEGEEEEGEGVEANLQRLAKGAAKKKVLRPQPKLNGDRLRSERGLGILPKMFNDVKFKGRGYEREDLKLMMGRLQHWAHRLFPKMPFDEFIERMEKLGSKREVMTCVKRIRLDMPITDEDYIQQYDDDNEKPPTPPTEEPEQEMDADEAWEAMIQQEREQMEQQQQTQQQKDRPVNGFHDTDKDDIEPEPRATQPMGSQPSPTPTPSSNPMASQQSSPPGQSQPSGTPSQANTPHNSVTQVGMTPEQQERMRKNKLVAMQKRAARLGVSVESLMSQSTVPSASQSTLTGASQSAPSGASQPQLQPESLSPSSQPPESTRIAPESQANKLTPGETADTQIGAEDRVTEEETLRLVMTESSEDDNHDSTPATSTHRKDPPSAKDNATATDSESLRLVLTASSEDETQSMETESPEEMVASKQNVDKTEQNEVEASDNMSRSPVSSDKHKKHDGNELAPMETEDLQLVMTESEEEPSGSPSKKAISTKDQTQDFHLAMSATESEQEDLHLNLQMTESSGEELGDVNTDKMGDGKK